MNCAGCMTICTTSKKPDDPAKCAGFIRRTNGNLLRSKSDEELAYQIVEWIEGVDPVSGTLYDNDPERWLDWLRQEADK